MDYEATTPTPPRPASKDDPAKLLARFKEDFPDQAIADLTKNIGKELLEFLRLVAALGHMRPLPEPRPDDDDAKDLRLKQRIKTRRNELGTLQTFLTLMRDFRDENDARMKKRFLAALYPDLFAIYLEVSPQRRQEQITGLLGQYDGFDWEQLPNRTRDLLLAKKGDKLQTFRLVEQADRAVETALKKSGVNRIINAVQRDRGLSDFYNKVKRRVATIYAATYIGEPDHRQRQIKALLNDMLFDKAELFEKKPSHRRAEVIKEDKRKIAEFAAQLVAGTGNPKVLYNEVKANSCALRALVALLKIPSIRMTSHYRDTMDWLPPLVAKPYYLGPLFFEARRWKNDALNFLLLKVFGFPPKQASQTRRLYQDLYKKRVKNPSPRILL